MGWMNSASKPPIESRPPAPRHEIAGRAASRIRTTRERTAVVVLAIASATAMAWLALPFITALLLGTLLAFSLEPAYRYLTRLTHRPLVASLIAVIVSGVVIIGALGGFVSVFVARTVQLTNAARQDLQSGGPLSHSVTEVTRRLARTGIDSSQVTTRIESSIGALASRAGSMAAALASGTSSALLDLFFALLTMYAVLRHWPRIAETIVTASPLHRDYTEALLEEFRRLGRTTISGTVLTGMTQGALASIGYAITGVPYPVFFGITTALASLLPAVGTLLVWVPAAVYLFATGHTAMASTELLWGVLVVVGLSDYVIRPRLVREETMPALLVFIALFGGLEVMGLAGLIVGPLIMGLALAVLRLYLRERSARGQ
jgi:predicted PurR-regulated permease PerM